MSSDKFAAELLAARDRRQAALGAVLQGAAPATLCLALNIPGPDKMPPGAPAVFAWALRAAMLHFPGLRLHLRDHDALGPYAIATLTDDAERAKRRCLAIEDSHPVARLVDLDIYVGESAPGGAAEFPPLRQVDRKSLGLPARPCLVCAEPAVDCMRRRRHPYPELIGHAHELLRAFAA